MVTATNFSINVDSGVKKVASGRYLPGWVVADEHRIVDGDGNNKQFNGCTV
ncbi:MAG: hypothetical protein GY928_39585, partial [Colwellia sp.]|nr:hypothetical protein [Colwellia sp.]